MDYQRVYNALIEKGKTQVLPGGTYTEKHHILPKSLGGSDKKSNLVRLTARQHYIAHKLLVFIYKKEADEGKDKTPYYKMLRAFTAMIYLWGDLKSNKRAPNICSRMYENWKCDLAQYKRTHNAQWLKSLSPQERQAHCKKVSLGLKKHFETHPGTFTGRKHKPSTIAKMHETHLTTDHQQGSKNSQYGKHWWHDPLTGESHSFHDNEVPQGWARGRVVQQAPRVPEREIKRLNRLPLIREQFEFWLHHSWNEFVEKYHYAYSKVNFVNACKRVLRDEWHSKRSL